jgi:gliding motility-associated-like protein
MKKLFFALFCFIIHSASFAQDCQDINQFIVETTISPTIELDSLTQDTIIYYDLCQGQTLDLTANATFPENNAEYEQTLGSTIFTWYLDEVEVEEGLTFSHEFNQSGGYIVSLYAEDINECETPEPFEVFVRVSTTPTLDLTLDFDQVCPGVATNISASGGSDINVNVDYNPDGWASVPCEDELADITFLPDVPSGTIESYTTDLELTCFGEGQTLTNINDILSIDLNIEHSYMGDLDITLTAPNGVEVYLLEYPTGGGIFLGEPNENDSFTNDNDPDDNPPGIGYDYGWSNTPSYNGTMSDGLADNTSPVPGGGFGTTLNSDTYFPTGNLSDFLGTPLNGTWTITITDNLGSDNGWIFSWGISINEAIIPSAWSFDNYITDEYWENDPSIIYNNGPNITIQPSSPGNYSYEYIIVDNFGCEYSEEIDITSTSYVNVTPSVTDDYCSGETGEISLQLSGGTPGYDVDWNTGESGTTIDELGEDTYHYTIVDDLGCESAGSIQVDNYELELQFNVATEYEHCHQGIGEASLTPLNGDAPYTYDWSNNLPNDSLVTELGEDTYNVHITDSYGCQGDETIEIINIPPPVAYFEQTFDTVVFIDGLVEFINFSTSEPETELVEYSWSFGNGQFSTDSQTEHDFNQIGNYAVQLTVTDGGGCTDSYMSEVIAVEDYFAWAPTAFTPNGDNVNDIFRPVFHEIIEESFEIYIYDRWGKLVYQSTDIDAGWDGIRQDNGIAAEKNAYSFVARFTTHRNILQEKTGSFVLLK